MYKKEKLRTNIILSAAEIFSQKGYEKTTMNSIAHSIEMGKSSLYYYFESKTDIFKAVVQYEANELTKNIQTSVNKENNIVEKIRVYVLSHLHHFSNFKNLYKALKSDKLLEISFIPEFRNNYYKNEIENFKTIIDAGSKQGLFTIYDTELAATAIITAIKGMETPIFINNIARDVESTIRDTVAIILYGIVKR